MSLEYEPSSELLHMPLISTSPHRQSKLPLFNALLCTIRRRILATASTNQEPEKDDLIPLLRLGKDMGHIGVTHDNPSLQEIREPLLFPGLGFLSRQGLRVSGCGPDFFFFFITLKPRVE